MASHTANDAPRTADADVHWPMVAVMRMSSVNR